MKNRTLWLRTILIIIVTLFGIYLVIGPRHSFTVGDFSWTGIKKNVADNINLGLDLKGGTHLVMRVKTDEYLATLTQGDQTAAFNAAKEANLPVTDSSFVAENGNYSVTLNLSDPEQAEAVIEAVKKKVDFFQWTETVSGNQITWTLPTQVQTTLKDQAVEQALQIIDSRINAYGVAEPTLQRHGATNSGQILLQMPGVDDPERVKNLIECGFESLSDGSCQPAESEFADVSDQGSRFADNRRKGNSRPESLPVYRTRRNGDRPAKSAAETAGSLYRRQISGSRRGQ